MSVMNAIVVYTCTEMLPLAISSIIIVAIVIFNYIR